MHEHLGLVFKAIKPEEPFVKVVQEPVHLGLVFKITKEAKPMEEPVKWNKAIKTNHSEQLGFVFPSPLPKQPNYLPNSTAIPKPALGKLALLFATGYYVFKNKKL